jgi:hypothetical protein
MDVTADDPAAALQLYTWNTAVSAAFYGPIQALEVSLRNSYDQILQRDFGADWWSNPRFLVTHSLRNPIEDVAADLRNFGKPVSTPNIVASLSFGFWTSLSGPGHRNLHETRLWIPSLHAAFPYCVKPGRDKVHAEIEVLRKLRNRIAHHEPVVHWNLQGAYDRLRMVLGWVSPSMIPWVEHHSRVPEILAARPATEIF